MSVGHEILPPVVRMHTVSLLSIVYIVSFGTRWEQLAAGGELLARGEFSHSGVHFVSQGADTFVRQPYHQLRHPMVFYYGHPAVLYVNKYRVAGLLQDGIDDFIEQLFETGEQALFLFLLSLDVA